VKNLEHIKMGCPGETSQGMIDGSDSYCYTEEMSQLDAAKMFLTAHPGEIAFITLDIGANDLLPCLDLVDPDHVNMCVFNVITQLSGNLATILTELKSVAPDVPIVGMNYYNPYLAAWLDPGGEIGQSIAVSTTTLIAAINHALEGVYGAFGVPVGDVANAFDTYDFTLNGSAPPRNVRTICRLTWMCEHGNIHPNKNGYKVIARTVEEILRASVSTASTELALRLGEYSSLDEGGTIFLPAVGR
jgi:lysophospholipase L1-like esterase